MKTLLITITDPTDGDLIVLEYNDTVGGGCTSVTHKVKGEFQRAHVAADGRVEGLETVPAETPAAIATILAGLINKDWMKEAFQARVKSDTLIVHCSGLVPHVKFKGFVEGDGDTQVTLTEF